MLDLPSWFNPEEYSDFLTESMSLFEFNAPYWKKRRELLADKRNRERAQAIRDGRERAQDAYDLAQAKAAGIMLGMGEAFKQELSAKFFEIVEEKTAIEQTKSEVRQETDPKRKERDRKREERRKEKLSPMSSILIVRHKKTNRIEIIMKSDYSEKSHQVIKGRVKNIDKGPVSKSDLIKATESAEFMNTKTSMKLIGKVQKGNKNQDDSQGAANSGGSQGEITDQEMETQQAPPPPPPMPRVPDDGKEITDPSSTYPDWDHDSNGLIAGIAYAVNPGQPMPPEFAQVVSTSRTLGDSINRALNELLNSVPQLAQMQFQLVPPTVKTGKMWGKSFGIPESMPNSTLLGATPEGNVGITIKVGEQIRPGIKGEAGYVFATILSTENAIPHIRTFGLMLEDFFKELKEVFLNTLPQIDREQKYHIGSMAQRHKERRELEQFEKNKKIFKNRAKNLIENFINQSPALKTDFIMESLTGNLKFDIGPGSCQQMISLNKDGTDAKLIPLSTELGVELSRSADTYLSLKFMELPPQEGDYMESLYQQMRTITESTVDVVVALERIKDQISHPVAFMQLLNIQLVDAVYSTPIDYSDFYEGDTDTDNIIILNPNSAEEEEIRIPVRKVFTSTGKEENRVELGADQILEEYLLLNDYLADMVVQENLSLEEATGILSEEFNFLTESKKKKKKKKKKKRNYRKEYDEYHGTAEQRANRSKRVLARRKMMKKGKVHKGDGKDVDHKNGNPQDNSDDNLRVLSKSKNRSIKEDHGAGFEGTPELVQKLINDTPFSTETPVLFGSRPYPESKLKKKSKK